MFTITVDRALRLRSDEPADVPMPIDEDGFLDGAARRHSSIAGAKPGDLLTAQAVDRCQALVILGEPGLGKSTLLTQVAEELVSSGGVVARLDGADLSEATLELEIEGALWDLRPPDQGGPRTTPASLIIDSLDESPIVPRLARRLGRLLDEADLRQFQLILGCRTADLPPNLCAELQRVFDAAPVLVDLAPLGRAEAIELATSSGVSGEKLINAAVARGAGSMAAVPLTLDLLVREFRAKDGLDAPPRVLFERGVTALLEAAGPSSTSTLDQRRAVAERIAVTTLLTGKRTIFVGRSEDATEHDLRDSLVTDGTESTTAGSFSVTPAHVRETLSTALFSGRGPDRVAFVHASQAAFLAANFLIRAEPALPTEQLKSLLLVAAPDGAESVPTSLREVGAWLAGMSARAGEWLARTDPESLVGHESYLDSPEIRALVVGSLLDRAAEFELGNRYWYRGLNLAHDGLAGQIVETLEGIGRQPTDYPEFARCRVALRLAEHAQAPALTDRLFEIAESTDWNSHMGSLAVDALVNADGTEQRLRGFLRALDDPEFARERDGDDQVRGHLLEGLWPRHIGLSEVLPSLRPRGSSLIGAYWAFLRRFPDRLTDDEVADALRWAADQAALRPPDDPSGTAGEVDDEEEPIGLVDPMLAEALVGRALRSESAFELLPSAAALTWPRLDRYDRLDLPEALDEGRSGDGATQLRRAFAEAMVRHRCTEDVDRVDLWHLLSLWRGEGHPAGPEDSARSSLLDSSDFYWAAERQRALAGSEPAVAEGLAQVAAFLYNAADRGHVETAWDARDTKLWPHVKHWFEAVEIDSPLADRLREARSLELDRGEDDPELAEQAIALRSDVLEHYESAAAGDSDHFWRLAYLLEFDPESTRRERHPFADRLLEFPGFALLPDDAPVRLVDAALKYVAEERDYAEDWLGTDRYDRRAWAGYLALAMIDDAGLVERVAPEVWANWSGAILWFWSVPSETADPDLKSRLLARATELHPERLAQLLVQFVRGELRKGSMASEIESFDGRSIRRIEETWIDLVAEVHDALLSDAVPLDGDDGNLPVRIPDERNARSNARFTFERIFSGLVEANPDQAQALATEWIDNSTTTDEIDLAAKAIALLMAKHPTAWNSIGPRIKASPERGRAVALALSDERTSGLLEAHADESDLRDLHYWLVDLFPPDEDPPDVLGSGYVTSEAQAIRWRDHILTTIADRGTETGLQILGDLHSRYPTRVVVLSNLVRARIAAFGSAWTPPTPAELHRLLADSRRRLVRSNEELRDLVRATLDEMQDDLARTGQLLWDRAGERGATPIWRPKPEAALSAFLAHELQLRLVGRGVAVHQEVLVKPTNEKGAGDQPDILVEATSSGNPSHEPMRFRVAMELKGAWNDELLVAQDEQLAARYLPETKTNVGLYVVGWFPLDQWDASDGPRQKAQRHKSAEALHDALALQAEEIRHENGAAVTPVVLTIPRPTPNA